jgi:hypothetical protein
MPLNGIAEYLYFLMIVLLWGWPVIAIVIWLAWRRQQLGKALKHIIVIVPIAALVGQILFHGGAVLEGMGYDRQQDRINAYLGNPDRVDVIKGGFVGTVSRSSLQYRRYQFPSLDGSTGHMLEIQLPPDTINTTGSIRLVKEAAPVQTTARLLIWPARISLNPAMAPNNFFQRNYPAEKPYAFGMHTLIIALRPRQSTVVHPRQDLDKSSWRWSDMILDLDAP